MASFFIVILKLFLSVVKKINEQTMFILFGNFNLNDDDDDAN